MSDILFDIETYPNYFCVGFMDAKSQKVVTYSAFGEDAKLTEADYQSIHKILHKHTMIGFNSAKFDLPILLWMLKVKPTNAMIARATKAIIDLGFNSSTYQVLKLLRLDMFSLPDNIEHYDLMPILPGTGSLKFYSACLNIDNLQDLPYEPNTMLTKAEADEIEAYNTNDLHMTRLCWDWANAHGEISNRTYIIDNSKLSKASATGVKIKSSVQVAELVLKEQLINSGMLKRDIKAMKAKTMKFTPPKYMHRDLWKHEGIKAFYDICTQTTFSVDGEKSKTTKTKFDDIVINNTSYSVGLGGLHSKDDKVVVASDGTVKLRNADVASYYPANIINANPFPPKYADIIFPTYKGYRDTRVKIKKTNKALSAVLKLFLNGTFGKLNEKFSFLFNPSGMLNVTITGQLALLLLIERLELAGYPVFSANTDGVEYLASDDDLPRAIEIISEWEELCSLTMEHDTYTATYNADVNRYIAIYPDSVKAKGIYAPPSLGKALTHPIVFKAIREYLQALHEGNMIDPYEIIDNCTDIREFIIVSNVTGGAVLNSTGEKLGKVIRYYYNGDDDYICRKEQGGNRVANTLGAKPIMNFNGDYTIPNDLYLNVYHVLFDKHLSNLGYDMNNDINCNQLDYFKDSSLEFQYAEGVS